MGQGDWIELIVWTLFMIWLGWIGGYAAAGDDLRKTERERRLGEQYRQRHPK